MAEVAAAKPLSANTSVAAERIALRLSSLFALAINNEYTLIYWIKAMDGYLFRQSTLGQTWGTLWLVMPWLPTARSGDPNHGFGMEPFGREDSQDHKDRHDRQLSDEEGR